MLYIHFVDQNMNECAFVDNVVRKYLQSLKIYWLDVTFEWSNRKVNLSTRARKKNITRLDVITTSLTKEEVLKDDMIMNKFLKKIKRKESDISISIKNIQTIQDCGVSNDIY